MASLILMMLSLPLGLFRTQAAMQAEIIALRLQVIVFNEPRRQSGSTSIARIGGCGFGFRSYGRAGVTP